MGQDQDTGTVIRFVNTGRFACFFKDLNNLFYNKRVRFLLLCRSVTVGCHKRRIDHDGTGETPELTRISCYPLPFVASTLQPLATDHLSGLMDAKAD